MLEAALLNVPIGALAWVARIGSGGCGRSIFVQFRLESRSATTPEGRHCREPPGGLEFLQCGFYRQRVFWRLFRRSWPGAKTNRVDYLCGPARNARLFERIDIDLAWAAEEAERAGRHAGRFAYWRWDTRKSWNRRRCVVAKAEWMSGLGPCGVFSVSWSDREMGFTGSIGSNRIP
jgi:hypothetical protein